MQDFGMECSSLGCMAKMSLIDTPENGTIFKGADNKSDSLCLHFGCPPEFIRHVDPQNVHISRL